MTSSAMNPHPLAIRSRPVSSDSEFSYVPNALSASRPDMISTSMPSPNPLCPPNHWSWYTDAACGSVVGRPSSSFAQPSGIDASPRLRARRILFPAAAVVATS